MKNDVTSLIVKAENGESLTINVPTDAVTVLQNLQPGEDYHLKLTGFTEDQLKKAFHRVCDKANWKTAINAYCAEKDKTLVERAIAFYTCSQATFQAMGVAPYDMPEINVEKGDTMLWVRANGYYADCGA